MNAFTLVCKLLRALARGLSYFICIPNSATRSGPNECMYKTITMCVRFVHNSHTSTWHLFVVRSQGSAFSHLLFDVSFLFGRLASTKISHNIIMSAINVVQQTDAAAALPRTYNVHLCGVFASSSMSFAPSFFFRCFNSQAHAPTPSTFAANSKFFVCFCNGVWLIRANSTDI